MMAVFDALAQLHVFARLPNDRSQPVPLLRCRPEWQATNGKGIAIGLLDGWIDRETPDLAGAAIIARRFLDTDRRVPSVHSLQLATLLVGQGELLVRGVAPAAHLFVADVLGCNGSAIPGSVCQALAWMIAEGVSIIAIPLGSPRAAPLIASMIDEAVGRDIIVIAAGGNDYPEPLAFPARHPQAIAVGAADRRGSMLPDCSRLPLPDLLAPGEGIPAPRGPTSLGMARGSSVACALTAGAAAVAHTQQCVIARDRASVVSVLCRQQCST